MPESRNDRLLVEETEFHDQNRERFLHEHTNRHLLIEGREPIGSYLTADQAVGEGVRRYGAGPFLVRLSGEDAPAASIPALALGLLRQSRTSGRKRGPQTENSARRRRCRRRAARSSRSPRP